MLLKSLGCEVYECEGLELTKPDGPIDLILSDVVLPGGNRARIWCVTRLYISRRLQWSICPVIQGIG